MQPASTNYRYQIFIIGVFFFIFGFITWTNSVLIPYLKLACNLQQEWQGYLVTFAFYISYAVMAIPCGLILKKTGMVKGLQLGLFIMAAGCLLFIPAANSRTYSLFLLGLFIIGTGLTILQTASNPYITVLGPADRAAQRISIMGICNKMAGALAPFILGAIMLQNADGLEEKLKLMSVVEKEATLTELASKVIMPYTILAATLAIVGFLLRFAHLPEVKAPEPSAKANEKTQVSIFQYPNLMLGFLAIFCSVAAEVIAGDSIIRYGQFHGFALDVARHLPSYTLISMVAGYIVGIIFIPKFLKQEKAFLIFNTIGIFLSLLVVFLPGDISVYCLAALGFANALTWPPIWPAALKGLPNKLIGVGSAILIMGILGGAVVPLLYGFWADAQNRQTAYLILLPLYVYNIFYWYKCMHERK
ncbi:MAG TPA: sugar MFS transporter [Panacibacter sp.]|nr:sugar MFS transporter [Panacibacter sp.]